MVKHLRNHSISMEKHVCTVHTLANTEALANRLDSPISGGYSAGLYTHSATVYLTAVLAD